MKTLLATTLIWLCLALSVAAQEATPSPAPAPAATPPTFTIEDAKAAIAAFKANPLAELPNPYLGTLFLFLNQSPNYTVVLSPHAMPWLLESDSPWGAILMGAFMAGNAEAQLNGQSGDQPEAGLMLAFEVYAKIRAKDPSYSSVGLEKLQKLSQEGKLGQYLRSEPVK